VHKEGKRYFPDGKEVGGANNALTQADPASVAISPEPPINKFDGLVHKDGKRFFSDGGEVGGANNRLNRVNN
jgi:hypothetical protein